MLQLNTAPTSEPVTRAELLDQLRIDRDDEDMLYMYDELDRIIKAARQNVENILDRAILTQTWDYYLDAFPDRDNFLLPLGNLQSVTSIVYTDSDSSATTMTVTTDYLVETNGEQHGRIVLPYNGSWPSTTLYPSKPIKVIYVCGWTSAALVPYDIKAGIMMIAVDLWEHRSKKNWGNMNFHENAQVMGLLNHYRLGFRSL